MPCVLVSTPCECYVSEALYRFWSIIGQSIGTEVRTEPGSLPLMTVKLSRDSFVSYLTKSGLIDRAALQKLLREHQSESQATDGSGKEDGELFAQFLIRRGELTTWQARKLLQGKHKGFLLGKYRLLSLLGRGGMSSVYLAEHVVMRRRCAIKVLPTKHVNDAAALDRFYQEAQAVAALDDPHIVRAYDVDQVLEGNTQIHFLVMEYVDGRSLQELVDQDGPLSLTDAVTYITQAASGLDHAHRAGMVHRDIKPSNLLLDSSGTVKVLDLGLARFFEQGDHQSLTLQHDQRVLGTADYLSPEQAVDSHTVGPRSDIYSLGGTLYFLLSGHPPFPEGSLAQRLLAHQTKAPKPITKVRPDVPGSFARILERLMAKNPEERPVSAGEARNELLNWLAQNGKAFAEAAVPPVRARPRQSADPTAAGWSDLPAEQTLTLPPEVETQTEQSVEPPAASITDSHVVDDPNLGAFLSSLSSGIDPVDTDSGNVAGAKTVVSGERPPVVPVDLPEEAGDDSQSAVTDPSSSELKDSDSSSSQSKSRRPQKPNIPIPVVVAAVAVLILLLAGYLFWPSSKPSGGEGVAEDPGQSRQGTQPDGPGRGGGQRPPVEPGADITVGPEGNFATINEAIAYVKNHFQPLSRTAQQIIRVTGGVTYPESIEIDNSSFSFPYGVSIVCTDAEPAVLAPEDSSPVVALVNVEQFRLEGLHLAGPQRPAVMRLEGFLGGTVFKDLTIEGGTSTGIEAVGASGLDRRLLDFQDLLILGPASDAIGIAFVAPDQTTKNLRVQNCRFAGPMRAGVSIAGETDNVQLRLCRFDRVATPIRFLDAGPFENVSVVNNTFRQFQQGIAFSVLPEVRRGGVGFHKNLFAGVEGPEVVVDDASAPVPPETILGQSGARFNWSEGAAASEVGSLNIFQQDGKRGIDPLTFLSTDVQEAAQFLKPQSADLRRAAQSAPPPKFIGAVAPAAPTN